MLCLPTFPLAWAATGHAPRSPQIDQGLMHPSVSCVAHGWKLWIQGQKGCSKRNALISLQSYSCLWLLGYFCLPTEVRPKHTEWREAFYLASENKLKPMKNASIFLCSLDHWNAWGYVYTATDVPELALNETAWILIATQCQQQNSVQAIYPALWI